MGTDFEKIYSLAMIDIKDYKLDNLYQLDKDAFLERMRSFLVRSIPRFDGCFKSLSYSSRVENIDNKDVEKWYFDEELDYKEISILSDLVVNEWWQGKINDVTAFSPHLANKNFKQYQESQSLKQKSEYYDKIYERVNKEILEYQFKNLSKTKFFGGGN